MREETIGRLIKKQYSNTYGIQYVYAEKTTDGWNIEYYLDFESAADRRRVHDWEKPRWTYIGLQNILKPIEPKSTIMLDYATGKYYVRWKMVDDELVSDLYSTKVEAKQAKRYLDKKKWHISALNTLKKEGLKVMGKYSGILPTKEGYVIMDFEKNVYGKCETLEEAMLLKKEVEEEGVLL